MKKKMTPTEARSGYHKDFSFNPDWKKHKSVCGYEHCIELMPLKNPRNKKSCPVFGHNCPGGKEMVSKCQMTINDIGKERMAQN